MPMIRTTIALPDELRLRAIERARQDGIPFAELVRQAIEARLSAERVPVEEDPIFGDVLVYDGPVPRDTSVDHDAYLYDETS